MTRESSVERIAELEAWLAEALKFLGHDAREGHSSTLALFELQRAKPDPMTAVQLAERVEGNARKSLAAIDDFAALVRARIQPLQVEELDVLDLLVEVVADAWPSASRAGVRIQVAENPELIMGWADRALLASALAKLLRDAVAAAARGTHIACALQVDADGACVFEIEAPDVLAAASASASGRRQAHEGTRPGAGWPLGRVVAERHGGTLQCAASTQGRRLLRLRLPVQASAEPTSPA